MLIANELNYSAVNTCKVHKIVPVCVFSYPKCSEPLVVDVFEMSAFRCYAITKSDKPAHKQLINDEHVLCASGVCKL